MILLDNKVYITNACQLLESAPGYRVIPLGVSCLTGSNIYITSLINLVMIFGMLLLFFQIFDFTYKQKKWSSLIVGLNSLIAFPYFYAAAHSYVYTIFAAIIGLYTIHKIKKFNIKSSMALIISAILLKLVRSEGLLYFCISMIAYSIYHFIKSKDLKTFWNKNKKRVILAISLIIITILFNYAFTFFLSTGEVISKNIGDGKYISQFPKNTYFAVAIWASLDYLRSFLVPFFLSFYGNYNDWFIIHSSFSYQVLLYVFLISLILMSSYFIINRKRSSLSYFIIGLAIFIIPTFLISSFLRNQWYYPSRSLLGAVLSLPFFIKSLLSIKKKKYVMILAKSLLTLSLTSFFIHHFFHFKDESSLYSYENLLLKQKHPTVNKVFAQKLLTEKNFFKATKILRDANRELPKEGINLSANHFFLWAENLYWSAASAYYYKSPLTEELVLRKLYKEPNYFSGLACIQDTRRPIEECSHPEYLRYLCHPQYRSKFGFKYYKPPRVKGEIICN